MIELRGIPHHQNCQFVFVQILRSYPGNIGWLDLFYSGTEALEIVSRIAIKLVSHALTQYLVGRIEIEDERIEDRVLRLLDFDVRQRVRRKIVDLLIERTNRLNRAGTLRSHGNIQHTGMVE